MLGVIQFVPLIVRARSPFQPAKARSTTTRPKDGDYADPRIFRADTVKVLLGRSMSIHSAHQISTSYEIQFKSRILDRPR